MHSVVWRGEDCDWRAVRWGAREDVEPREPRRGWGPRAARRGSRQDQSIAG